MTLPYEEVNSLKETRKFLVQLMTIKPAAPKWIRQRASGLLKHFPWEFQGVNLIPMDELYPELYTGFEEKTYPNVDKRKDKTVAKAGKMIMKKYKKALKKLKD
jgi:hypothetical protein